MRPPGGRLLRGFARFWEQDRGLSVLLLFLILLVLVSGPLLRLGRLGEFFLSALLTITLVSGVFAASRRPWAAVVTGGVAAFAIVAEWAGRWWPSPALEAADALGSCACVVIFAGIVLYQVLRTGRITIHKIVGAAAAYLLIGLAWGNLYRFVAVAIPGSIASSAGLALDRTQFVYFSIVTLTTLGYGDIVPVHPFARSLAMLEALTGQLFPAILIARLVSMELLTRGSDPD